MVSNINRSVSILNGLTGTVTSFDDVKNPLGDIYSSVAPTHTEAEIPTMIRKKAIDLLCLKDRCKEELVMVKDEMSTFSSFFLKQIDKIQSFSAREVYCQEQIGLRSLFLTKVLHYLQQLQVLKKMWSSIILLAIPDRDVTTFLLAKPSDPLTYIDHENDAILDETAEM